MDLKQYEENGLYNGFILKSKKYLDEIGSNVLIFEYKKNKASLIAIKNDDINKTFSINFKTIPENSKGIPHIIEHSVLSGSVKYPLKDVFGELIKGGLTTFLNAMTAPDKTFYLYSTRNEKEYFNLMSVYMDTSLRPLLKEETFMQEGWHHEILDKKDPLTIKGIVYNEMKGAMSSPMSQLYKHCAKELYPGTVYAHNSGGDPRDIPDLSYEEFKQFHKDFYHPSNSMVFVYGNAELDKELAFVNDNYFKDFEYRKVNSEIVPPKDIQTAEKVDDIFYKKYTYSVNTEEDAKNKSFISLSARVGSVNDMKTNFAFSVLDEILFDSDASPLKQAIIKSGISTDFAGNFDNSKAFTSFFIYISGSDEKHKEKFIEIYKQVLKEIVEKGIDKKLVMSVLNKIEFRIREQSVNVKRGLYYLFNVVNAAFYNFDIFNSLCVNDLFAEVRKDFMENNLFENLVKKYMLGNEPNMVVVSLVPEIGKNKKLLEEEIIQLENYKKSLSDEELEILIDKSKKLIELQKEPTSPEDIKKIPKLELEDIEKEKEFYKPTILPFGDKEIIFNNFYTNDIVYLSIGLKLDKLPKELLPYLGIFSDLLSEIGTSKSNYTDFIKEKDTYIGGIYPVFKVHTQLGNRDDIMPVLWIEIKTLTTNMSKTAEILHELFSFLDFGDTNRIKEVLSRNFNIREREIKTEGLIYPYIRLKAYFTKQGCFQELTKGLTAYELQKNILADYVSEEPKLLESLKKIKSYLFNKENILVAFTGDEKIKGNLLEKNFEIGSEFTGITLDYILSSFEDKHFDIAKFEMEEFGKNQAFLTPSEIVFAGEASDLNAVGFKYNGKFEVLKNFLSTDYLMNTIRVIGGAYGVMVSFSDEDGIFTIMSYRDPNVKNSYDAYEKVPEALESINLSKEQFLDMKIGAYSSYNPLLNSYSKGVMARNDYLSNINKEYYDKIINDIFDVTLEDIKKLATYFRKVRESGNVYKSIIGNAEKIRTDKELFDESIEL